MKRATSQILWEVALFYERYFASISLKIYLKSLVPNKIRVTENVWTNIENPIILVCTTNNVMNINASVESTNGRVTSYMLFRYNG